MNLQYRLHILGNTLALIFICIIIIIALKEQYIDHTLPCPLCFLQRVAYSIIGLSVCLNLAKGPSPINYGGFILGCLFGIVVAGRQVLLHIMPGDKGYGLPVLGLFPYTWNVIIFFILLIICGLSLHFYKGFEFLNHKYTILSKLLITFFTIILIASFISVLNICGLRTCPDDPMAKHTLQSINNVKIK